MIQAIEFVFCVFAFYYQYFRACIIHFHGHEGRAKLLLPTQVAQPSLEAIFDVSRTEIVYAFLGLLLLHFKYSNKGLHVKYGSMWQCSSTLGTFEAPGASYPNR